jgi:nucleoside-diphosphate-sugar epimerase
MRVVILGASGQIGSVIYDGLRNDYDVVGTSRKASEKYQQFDPFSDNWMLLGKMDVLINCVGQIEATRSSSFYKIHVDLTKLIIRNREAIGNPGIIQISALGASPGHKVEFLRTKGIADEVLLQHPATAVVRPSIVCTHRTMIVQKMLMLFNIASYTQGLVVVPKGFLTTTIQPIMPQDLINVIKTLCILPNPPTVVNAVGPQRLSFGDIIKIMFTVRVKKFRVIAIPRLMIGLIVNYGISILFPRLINSQQYELLFDDNVADARELEKITGTKLTSPQQFFLNEFSYATH